MQCYDVITNRTMQHCNYITATLHYATLPFFASYRIQVDYSAAIVQLVACCNSCLYFLMYFPRHAWELALFHLFPIY